MNDATLILFDCDGTLMDSHLAIVKAMQQAFASCDLPAPADESVRKIIGLSLFEAIRRLCDDEAASLGVNLGDIEDAYRRHYREGEGQVALYDGVIETLDSLQSAGYWMAVVTGKSKAGLLRVLEQFGLGDYFLTLRTADCCPSKPHPAMALECMAELGVRAENTTLVGDAVFDMQMAQQANVRAVGVSFGVASSADLSQAGAMGVVDDFPTLLRYFKG